MTSQSGTTLAELLALLDLETQGPDRFIGHSPEYRWGRIYGGQVIGQALAAAARTVPADRHCHSLHCYFMRPGDPKVPIRFDVARLRDGRSFATRQIVATQRQEAIFAMGASYHVEETGFEHEMPMPAVPRPHELPDEEAMAKSFPKELLSFFDQRWPFEFRPTDSNRIMRKTAFGTLPVQSLWMRSRGLIEASVPLSIHQALLAYASDWALIDTGLIGHGYAINDPDLQGASLDHALWFHRPFRADSWLLFHQDSPSAHGARTLCRGSIYTEDGSLIASVAQEGLFRVIKKPATGKS